MTGCILSSCLFNLYAEYILRNAELDESQARIKIAMRNTHRLKCADDITLMADSEEELKSLLMRGKEESEKAGLKPNIQKSKIMASSPITSWQIDGRKSESSGRFYFLGLQKSLQMVTLATKSKDIFFLGRTAMTNLTAYSKAETLLCQQRSV